MVEAVSDNKRVEYTYNGFLKRVRRLEGINDMRYILDLTRPYNDLLSTETSDVSQRFIWGNELVAAEGDNPLRYLNDHLGSPVRLIGENSDDALVYDEFGVPDVMNVNIHNPFGFTGYQYDEVTGLQFAQARYYEAGTGRFVSEDGARDGVNWYGYCAGNPVGYVDRDGLAAWLIHGTFKNSDTWTDDFREWVVGTDGPFKGEQLFLGDWSDTGIGGAVIGGAGNSLSARQDGANAIFNQILNYHRANPNEPIHLVGHSHGGNVAILVANMLAQQGIQVETLITIGTPVREYTLTGNNVKQHINVYNNIDGVQTSGGQFGLNMLNAGRTFDGALNIEVVNGLDGTNWQTSHSAMHSIIPVWEEYILPEISFKNSCSNNSVCKSISDPHMYYQYQYGRR